MIIINAGTFKAVSDIITRSRAGEGWESREGKGRGLEV